MSSQQKESTSSPQRQGLYTQLASLDSRYWIVNIMEMFERLAYYGVRAVIAIYMVLPREKGGPEFTHVQKGSIFAWWAAVQSLLPMFTGGFADRYGHKRTVAFAIVLKIIGYIMMAKFMSFWGFFFGCILLAAGTAIFKPGVQGTLAATLKESNASVGWGIFYLLVNIGGFLGPVVAGLLRVLDWQYVFYACAVIVSINFLWLPFYRDPTEDMEIHEDMQSPISVLVTSVKGLFQPRVLFFCIVFSGFWVMFNQVFDLLPNYIDDWVNSSGIIASVGHAFTLPAVPTLLAGVLGIVYGGVCAVGILLAMRPDQRSVEDVPPQVYAVVAIAFAGCFYFPIAAWMGGKAAGLIAPSLAVVFAILSYDVARFSAKTLAYSAFAIASLGSFLAMQSQFSQSAQSLTQMAKQGAQVPPEWMLNLNPGLIVFTMLFFAYLSSFMRPLTSIIVGMIIATLGSVIAGTAIVGWICLAGILVFSVGEMLSSPKKMEYLASLSPKGQEGLFMGYANVPVAIGWIVGSKLAGSWYEAAGDKANLARKYLQEIVGMDPNAIAAIKKSEVVPTLANKLNMTALEVQQLLFQTYEPHRIWYGIGAIGVASIVGMLIYDRVLKNIDKKAA
jgi:dipeptide/tripeptide permease